MKPFRRIIFFLLIGIFILGGCGIFKPFEVDRFSPLQVGELYLTLTPEAKAFIDITPQLRENKQVCWLISADTRFCGQEKHYDPVMMNLHGENSLSYFRKCLELHFPEKDFFFTDSLKMDEFIIRAMMEDYGYINNYLANACFARLGLFFSHGEYLKTFINGSYTGLYFLVEKSKEAIQEKTGNPAFIFRRNYGPNFESVYTMPGYENLRDSIANCLYNLYKLRNTFSHDSLLNEVEKTLDFNNYCRWLGVNKLLNNHDYLDEVYFYSVWNNGGLVFRVTAWDVEEIFGTPHNGRETGSLVFCNEDSLDAAIIADSTLYRVYCANLKSLLCDELTIPFIDSLESTLRAQVVPLFRDRATATIMSNFSTSPSHAADELNSLITKRFSFIRAHRDSILSVLQNVNGR